MLTLKEIAQVFRVNIQTVRRMVKRGELKAGKLNGEYRVVRENFLQQLSDGSLGVQMEREQALRLIAEALSDTTITPETHPEKAGGRK